MNYPHPTLPHSTLRLIAWRHEHRATLRGFATVEIDTACGPLEIRDIAVHQSYESRFVAMPAGAYISGGQAQYKNILKWKDIAPFRAGVIKLVENRDPTAFAGDSKPTREEDAELELNHKM